jgi:hypothetical protein
MGRAEFKRRLEKAPRFRYRPPSDRELAALVAAYEVLIGRRVSMAVMNLLVTCFRVHGPDSVRHLQTLHLELGTTTNLLAELRLREPTTFAATDQGGLR